MKTSRIVLLACIVGLLAVPLLASTDCSACHADAAKSMAKNVHLRLSAAETMGGPAGCVGCHGDGEKHAAAGDPALIRNFKESEKWDAVCLGCHSRKRQGQWKSTVHALEGVGCVDCHAVHKTNVRTVDACRNCHADTLAAFDLPSRHPLRDGQMTCSSCHDVHAATEAALKTTQRVNDLCFSCHQSKEGPFIFEHEPVQEDCRICHAPHGSVGNNLLVSNEPTICLQCHEVHFHAGYIASSTPLTFGGQVRYSPYGAQGFNVGMTTKCTQCHSKIHGSDLPSNSVSSRGRALTR